MDESKNSDETLEQEETMDAEDVSDDEEEEEDDDDELEEGNESEEGAEDNDNDGESVSDSENSEGDDGENSDGSNGSDSDNSERDKCCICLHVFRNQEIGIPTVCEHRFCCECITEWHKNSQTCPIDRQTFSSISVLKDDGTFVRMEQLIVPEDTQSELHHPPDDITHCEVCGLGDREDRLLLCDECDCGYHLECLNPPLQTVPLDDWFCPNCTERIPSPTRRVAPEIHLPPAEPETIQRSLLTRRIRQRRQKSRRKTKTVRRRKTTRRRRKTTTKGKSKSKTTRKRKTGSRKRKGRKVRRKTKRKSRVVVQEKPTTTRDRLASHLGIVPPKPGQIYLGLPTCKLPSQPSTSAGAVNSLNHHKFRAGISTLRLYSHYEDLADCLENESDDEQVIGDASVGLVIPGRHRISRVPNKLGLSAPAGIENPTSNPNILSEILSSQQTLLMDRNIRIGKDGVLIPSVDSSTSNNEPSTPTKSKGVSDTGAPNGKIRQAPLNNSETSSSNSNQRSLYSNDDSVYTSRRRDSTSRSDNNDGVFNSVVNSRNHDNNDERTGTVELRSSDHCVQSAQKSQVNKPKRGEDTNSDDDEDLYSDIQESKPKNTIEPEEPTSSQAELGSGDAGPNESDNEMIIVEDSGKGESSSSGRKVEQEVSKRVNAGDYVNFPAMSDSDDSPSPGMPEADSPESIPLPDTTPPPSVPMPSGPEDDDDEVDEIQGGSVLYSPSDDDESGRQVYDPSQPLTSSDEEELNDRQQKQTPKTTPPPPKESTSRNQQQQQPPLPPQAKQAASTSSRVDVSSIPVPPGGDEQRRPTIQFSIPTRHKLIPISSLIKRQRGVAKKESSGNNQFDTSKLFSDGLQQDSTTTDGTNVSMLGSEKPSLVAEIFGSDDEEESKDATPNEPVAPAPGPTTLPNDGPGKLPTTSTETVVESESVQSTKWKRVAETPAPMPEPQIITNREADVIGDSRNSISSNGEAGLNEPTPPATEVTEERNFNLDQVTTNTTKTTKKASTSCLEQVSDGSDDDEITIISTTRKEDPDVIFLSSEKSTTHVDSSNKDRDRRKESKESDKRSRKESDDRHSQHSRSQKRKRSSSLSNYEEGEIPSLDKKKKEVKKNKKTKKRKRSKDSHSHSSPRVDFNEKQSERPELEKNLDSSPDMNDERKVSWRKPSKSTKERNYRDGKSKTEEKYFREKDKEDRDSDRKDKDVRDREKSPHHRSRDRRGSRNDGKRSHRRSTSRHSREKVVSPIRWSRSPSPPRSRARGRRDRNQSRSWSSKESFSPRHSTHTRGRHVGHPLSSRNDRSRSRSPRLRSPSPGSNKHRHHSHHRTSRSKNRSRSNHGRSGRGGNSSSGSRSRSKSKTRRRHDKLDSGEKAKKSSSKRDKEKVIKENLDEEQQDIGTKDKEKKKKRKKKEKSISPAKAVFADGDSIVISLNFQKPKETSSKEQIDESNEQTCNEEPAEKKKKRNSNRDSTSSSKSKPLKKTVLIDLETSPIQEQKIGESPTLVVLSDEEDEKSKSSKKVKDYQNDKEHEGVTTSLGVHDSSSSNFQLGKGVQADSTQIHQTETLKLKDSIFNHEDSTSSPARGDSIVSSTKDAIEGSLQLDEDGASQSNSPRPPEPPSSNDNNSPEATTPPLPQSPDDNRQIEGVRTESFRGTPTSSASFLSNSNNPNPTMHGILPNSGQGLVRPLGIGNIPGLFPSSSMASGLTLPTPSVVIPTPPAPQMRFAANPMNPSINILASVANALYGPLMAARQGQPLLSKPLPTTNNISQWNTHQSSNILLPKNQNSQAHGRRTGGDGGDSPFSPNSSDGDDLFEPPMEERTAQNMKDTQTTSSTNSVGHKSDKTDRVSTPNQPHVGASSATAPSTKSKTALFDSLFGSPSKKPSSQPSSGHHHSKLHVKTKSKSHESSKSKVPKPDVHKQLTEGELRQTEDVPTSAVELRVKEKYLKKLNRQERVVEEVKLALKPHYGKKIINKDDYKEILRRAVPKICHTKSGEINPFKIKELVEAYVKKFRHPKNK